jgi:hypothetical protein
MAADVSLPLPRIVAALQAFFGMLSDPDTLPEFRAIQVCKRMVAAPCSWACAMQLCMPARVKECAAWG